MGVWLGRAQPGNLDEAGTLTLEFEPGADSAVSFFQAPQNRDTLETFLRKETDNVTSFQSRQAKRPAKAHKKSATNKTSARVRVTSADHERLLKDVGIATVMEEFKGVIVDVKNKRDA